MSGFMPGFVLGAVPLWEEHFIAIVAGGALLALQVLLCLRFLLVIRGKKAALDRVRRAGRMVRGDLGIAVGGRFPWLAWVDASFPPGATGPGNLTRDDVVQELDHRLASSPSFVLLQRTGVMAPLLGVLITVAGFVTLKLPDSSEQSLRDILLAVTPLVTGVGIGAALAFVNQWLLHACGLYADTLRVRAREWFDAEIWQRFESATHTAQTRALAAVEAFAQAITQSAAEHARHAEGLGHASQHVKEASLRLGKAMVGFLDGFEKLPQKLTAACHAVEHAGQKLGELAPRGQEILAGLHVSVAAFHDAVDHNFVAASASHRNSAETLAAALTRLESHTRNLQAEAAHLADAIVTLPDDVRRMLTEIVAQHDGARPASLRLNERGAG